MKGNLKILLADNTIRLTIFASLVLIIMQGVLIAFFFNKLPPLVPLLNSQPWGETRLYPYWMSVLILPVLIFVFIVNHFLGAIFYKKNSLVGRILVFNAFLFIFLAAIAFVQIILLVF
jgi:hypothetical protein